VSWRTRELRASTTKTVREIFVMFLTKDNGSFTSAEGEEHAYMLRDGIRKDRDASRLQECFAACIHFEVCMCDMMVVSIAVACTSFMMLGRSDACSENGGSL
jgi:hypothetical protein